MADLNLNITAEEQEELEMKVASIMGGGIINSYGSVSAELISVLLTAQQKPRNIEEMLATQEIYGNAVKKLFGIEQTNIDIEKVKVYNNIKSIVENFEQQMGAQAEQQSQMEAAKAPVVVESTVTVDDIESDVEKVTEATKTAIEAVKKSEKVLDLPKEKTAGKKTASKKATKSISNKQD